MRSPYFLALVAALIIGGVYWYQATSHMCPIPVHYSLGDIDSSFGLSEEEVLAHLQQTEDYWESQIDRELFVHDPEADFEVNFIFDDRQKTAVDEENLRNDLDSKKAESERVRTAIEELQTEYDNLLSLYEEQTASYESRLEEYNAEVNKYNDRGGAPPEEYERLEEERAYLDETLEELQGYEAQLNELASEINELGDRGNRLVDSYNEEVNKYNHNYGHAREFTQGDYQVDSINIYKFSSDNELQSVLAHEFGHALGIGHVEGTSSVMYYLLEDTENPPQLSQEDLATFYEVCGTSENLSQKIRRFIRNFI